MRKWLFGLAGVLIGVLPAQAQSFRSSSSFGAGGFVPVPVTGSFRSSSMAYTGPVAIPSPAFPSPSTQPGNVARLTSTSPVFPLPSPQVVVLGSGPARSTWSTGASQSFPLATIVPTPTFRGNTVTTGFARLRPVTTVGPLIQVGTVRTWTVVRPGGGRGFRR